MSDFNEDGIFLTDFQTNLHIKLCENTTSVSCYMQTEDGRDEAKTLFAILQTHLKLNNCTYMFL
jgi:hypothetical protein